MSDQEQKLSPSEFLAQIKQDGVSPSHLGGDNADSLDGLDFDDLDLDLNESEEEHAEQSHDDSDENSDRHDRAESVLDRIDSLVGSAEESSEEEVGEEKVAATDEANESNSDGASNEKTADQSEDGETEDHKPVASDSDATSNRLSELFDRVNTLLGDSSGDDDVFRPRVPETLEETGLNSEQVEQLILKYLVSKGSATGRSVCSQIRLPFLIVDPILKHLKQDQLITFKGAAQMGDYEFVITDYGRDRGLRYSEECTYFGSAPVAIYDYLQAMEAQSIAKQEVTEDDLRSAFSDLIINDAMFARLGPAINSGRGMFLFGEPGNGKTSIAERVTRCFGTTIWIPRALVVAGDIIRLYDPGLHEAVEEHTSEGIFDLSGVDQRWVQIVRPTVMAGGELTMDELEITQNPQTKICEAPLQLKSNCGTLVIDDFGRQIMPVDVLLNRWIIPLEKRYDFLNMPSGKKIQVPFDQLIIFSTNLEPKDLVDGAFLRRIPYKIEVLDPTEAEFRELCELMAPIMGFEYKREVVDYLIETHYKSVNRPFRACQPRDLLLQVRNFCVFKRMKKVMTNEGFDFAIDNYFSVM